VSVEPLTEPAPFAPSSRKPIDASPRLTLTGPDRSAGNSIPKELAAFLAPPADGTSEVSIFCHTKFAS
jgi:hypothetical protein